MSTSTPDEVQVLPVDKGNLIPKEYTGNLRTFVVVDGLMQVFAEGALFTDGRVVLYREGGRIEERYDCMERLVQEWFGRGALLWCGMGTPRTGPRRFIFRRHRDGTGFSGEGAALEGVQFTHGGVKLMWLGQMRSFVEWESIEQALTTHGHDGDTRIEWLD